MQFIRRNREQLQSTWASDTMVLDNLGSFPEGVMMYYVVVDDATDWDVLCEFVLKVPREFRQKFDAVSWKNIFEVFMIGLKKKSIIFFLTLKPDTIHEICAIKLAFEYFIKQTKGLAVQRKLMLFHTQSQLTAPCYCVNTHTSNTECKCTTCSDGIYEIHPLHFLSLHIEYEFYANGKMREFLSGKLLRYTIDIVDDVDFLPTAKNNLIKRILLIVKSRTLWIRKPTGYSSFRNDTIDEHCQILKIVNNHAYIHLQNAVLRIPYCDSNEHKDVNQDLNLYKFDCDPKV